MNYRVNKDDMPENTADCQEMENLLYSCGEQQQRPSNRARWGGDERRENPGR